MFKLSGTVFEDTNAPDADTIESSDSPISGVTVQLFNADSDGNPTGEAIASTETNEDGFYEFTDLANGDYVVKETQPGGFESVTDIDGNDDNQIAATIDGADSINNDFLEETPLELFKLSGTVFDDTNEPDADGIEGSDSPIQGVTVQLFNADSDGNPTGEEIASTTTDDAGFYEFADLANGEYVVKETQPGGFESVTDIDGTDDNQIAVTITDGNSTGNDFLEEVPPVLYALSGTVFDDTNEPDADGIEPTDTPIAGVTVELFNADDLDNAIASTTTDDAGFYEFTDLANGEYVVKETQPSGYESVTDIDGTDDNQIAAVIDGGDSVGNDFLEEVPPVLYALSGTVFDDTNAPDADAIETDDTPIAGVTVELFNADDLENAIASTETNEQGFYEFSDLANGEYVVVETQPSGYESVTDIDGTDDNQIAATIDGADSINNDFLEEVPPVLYALSGTVYDDTNEPNNDDIEPTDTPIAGVTVELFNADDLENAIASTETNEQGFYEFSDLANGEYVVVETQPSGYESVTDIDGTDDNQIAATIDGADSINNDFLEEVPPVLYALSGTVYDDTNEPGNDDIEPTDTPIAGVTVELFNADDLDNAIASTETDDAGFYEFTELANGEYVVKETQPGGFESVTDIDGTDDNQIAATIDGADSINNDFLEEVPPVLYALSGTVFDDTNAPGQDSIEDTDTPIAGVTVELFNADDLDNAIASTETNEDGFYEFADLANGEYVVKETQPGGFESVTDIDGTDDNQIAVTITDVQ